MAIRAEYGPLVDEQAKAVELERIWNSIREQRAITEAARVSAWKLLASKSAATARAGAA